MRSTIILFLAWAFLLTPCTGCCEPNIPSDDHCHSDEHSDSLPSKKCLCFACPQAAVESSAIVLKNIDTGNDFENSLAAEPRTIFTIAQWTVLPGIIESNGSVISGRKTSFPKVERGPPLSNCHA